jgi:hypothetical protein
MWIVDEGPTSEVEPEIAIPRPDPVVHRRSGATVPGTGAVHTEAVVAHSSRAGVHRVMHRS